MNPSVIKPDALYQRYKQQKLLVSTGFIRILLRFLCLVVFVTIVLAVTIQDSTREHILSLTFALVLLILIQLLSKVSKLSYFFGLVFAAFCQYRMMRLGLLDSTEDLTVCFALSCFYLWHCQLEFVYNSVLGYILITLHLAIWCGYAVHTEYIKTTPPLAVIFRLIYFIIVQFLWYTYQVSRDYEYLKNKIEIEISEMNVKNLLNAIPEGVVVLNEKLEILMSNTPYLKIMQEHGILELKLHEKFNLKERNTCKELMGYVQEFIISSDIITNFGVCFFHNFYLECTGSKAQWNNELSIVLTFREVSNIIKLQSEVNSTSKTLKILQGISHELKTPLNKIINEHQDFIFSSEEFSQPVKRHMIRSYSSAKYLLSLIKDMVDYSHIKVKSLALSLSWVRIDESILECIQMFKDINISYEIVYKKKTVEKLSVYTDKNRLKQCLLSLIGFSLG